MGLVVSGCIGPQSGTTEDVAKSCHAENGLAVFGKVNDNHREEIETNTTQATVKLRWYEGENRGLNRTAGVQDHCAVFHDVSHGRIKAIMIYNRPPCNSWGSAEVDYFGGSKLLVIDVNRDAC